MQYILSLFADNPLLAWLGVTNILLFMTALALSQLDKRMLNGINVWIKPMKFYLSIWLYTWTIGWLMRYLPPIVDKRLWSAVIMLSMVVEILCLTIQAARGVKSHFNNSSPFNTLMFASMGVGILVNTLVSIIIAYLFFMLPVRLPLPELWGARLGFIIYIIGSVQGGSMAGRMQHSVGTTDEAAGIFFLNWNKLGGDLRIAHFLGLHALQLIPLFSVGAYHFCGSAATIMVFAFAAAYMVLVAALYVQAIRGRSLFAR